MGEAGILCACVPLLLRARPPRAWLQGPGPGPGQRALLASLGPWQLSPGPAGPPSGPTVSQGWEAAELGDATGPQLPAYLLWEPATQPFLADDLLCTSSGHPAMGKAGPGTLQTLF